MFQSKLPCPVFLKESPGTAAEIAAAPGVPAETLRKIETGRIATPALFTMAALAEAVGLLLEGGIGYCAHAESAWRSARKQAKGKIS